MRVCMRLVLVVPNTCCFFLFCFICQAVWAHFINFHLNKTKIFVSNLLPFCLPAASCGMSTRWKCASTTIWISSAPTTLTTRCHSMRPSAMCCTWWRGRTMRSASLTPSTSSVGNAHGLSLPTLRRNSQRNSSALLPSL